MSQEDMEKLIQFIVEQQAKNTVGMEQLQEAQLQTNTYLKALSKDVAEVFRTVEALSKDGERVTRNIDELTGIIAGLTESVRTMEVQAELDRKDFHETMESMREEIRESFDKLILANEVTRDLANKIGDLAYNTSKRVSRLEHEVFPETSS